MHKVFSIVVSISLTFHILSQKFGISLVSENLILGINGIHALNPGWKPLFILVERKDFIDLEKEDLMLVSLSLTQINELI